MHENVSKASIKSIMNLHDIDETDLDVVRKYGVLIAPRMGEFISIFYE